MLFFLSFFKGDSGFDGIDGIPGISGERGLRGDKVVYMIITCDNIGDIFISTKFLEFSYKKSNKLLFFAVVNKFHPKINCRKVLSKKLPYYILLILIIVLIIVFVCLFVIFVIVVVIFCL